MTRERWEHVERLFHAALAKEPNERSAFLQEACAGDPELREEVESLLAEESPPGSFLREPALHRAARAIAAERSAPTQTLSPGTRLGPYEIEALLGAGGMGEVYKARDPRLDRTVAVKVLSASFTADRERQARFEGEAKAIASLSHPHICRLYDIGEHEGTTYLVMEHLAGETLAARLRKGPLPLDRALVVAMEIAEALSAAHRQGVVHRDLKPGNVMLTTAGAKLLDFGLAKLTGRGEQPAAQLSSGPTRAESLTEEGMILGTLDYMAPEQVEGRPVDPRTDLWALGAILYEMTTGRCAFEGTSTASLMAAILERDPAPISAIRPQLPRSLGRLVGRCLAKAPDDRPDTAHDVADDLRWIIETGSVPMPKPAGDRRTRGMALLLAGIVFGIAVGASNTWLRPSRPPDPLVNSTLPVNPADELNAGGSGGGFLPTPGGSRTSLAWTPDGRALVFVGRRSGIQQLHVRNLEATEASPLPGTEGAQVPAVSPDGQYVAFWTNGVIKKVRMADGNVVELLSYDATQLVTGGPRIPPAGMTWYDGDTLLAGSVYGSIWAIPQQGKPQQVTTLAETEQSHGLPFVMPGGRAILYTVRRRMMTWGDQDVVAQALAAPQAAEKSAPRRTGEPRVLIKNAADARYLPTGHLLFLRDANLFAVAFDAGRLQLVGKEEAVLNAVAQAQLAGNNTNVTGAGQFAVASTGALAWVPGGAAQYPKRVLVSMDRSGRVTQLPAPPRSYRGAVRLSPDGRHLAVLIHSVTEISLWLCDVRSGRLTPLVRGGEVDCPAWAPDGRRLVFQWVKDGRLGLGMRPVDAERTSMLALTTLNPSSWSPRGEEVAGVLAAGSGWEVGLATLERDKASVRALWPTGDIYQAPQFSPDGRWLAYGHEVSKRFEVYVRPFPGPGAPEAVSVEGGSAPAWNPANGRELFFVSLPDATGKRRMMAADFAPRALPRVRRLRPLFDIPADLGFGSDPVRSYDIAPDGQTFYAGKSLPPPPLPLVTHVNLAENWLTWLRAKVSPNR